MSEVNFCSGQLDARASEGHVLENRKLLQNLIFTFSSSNDMISLPLGNKI